MEEQKSVPGPHGRWLRLWHRFFARHELLDIGRCGRAIDHLGLEDHQALRPDQGSLSSLHGRQVASPRIVSDFDMRLGRSRSFVGLELQKINTRFRIRLNVFETKLLMFLCN